MLGQFLDETEPFNPAAEQSQEEPQPPEEPPPNAPFVAQQEDPPHPQERLGVFIALNNRIHNSINEPTINHSLNQYRPLFNIDAASDTLGLLPAQEQNQFLEEAQQIVADLDLRNLQLHQDNYIPLRDRSDYPLTQQELQQRATAVALGLPDAQGQPTRPQTPPTGTSRYTRDYPSGVNFFTYDALLSQGGGGNEDLEQFNQLRPMVEAQINPPTAARLPIDLDSDEAGYNHIRAMMNAYDGLRENYDETTTLLNNIYHRSIAVQQQQQQQ